MSKKCYDLIDKYYSDNPKLRELLITHVELVRKKALSILEQKKGLNLDADFVSEACLLHGHRYF